MPSVANSIERARPLPSFFKKLRNVMNHRTEQKSQEQEQVAEVHSQQTSTREFTSPEELLQHDAAQTLVPPTVANRLADSLRSEPKPERSWWRRIFGG